ncbi:MAG: hypothetical protein JWL61_4989 [Gemmatimonadetes bacterium]|nr:hypothetical protein [Gemmatimonadota bacterium]
MVSVAFAREAVSADLLTEALPLLTEHWKEIATHADIPLAVDTRTYIAAGEAGVVRLFTARLPDALYEGKGSLVGYACFFVKPHMHYAGSVQAVQDVLYLHPAVRGGTGAEFISWCDEQLRSEGVQVVHHHAKQAHPQLGKALERLGYQAVETVYSRRLDSFTGALAKTEAEAHPLYVATFAEDGSLRAMSRVAPPHGARIPWSAADATNDANRTGHDLSDFSDLMTEMAVAYDGEDGG